MHTYLVTSEYPDGRVEQTLILYPHELSGCSEITHEERNSEGPNTLHHFQHLLDMSSSLPLNSPDPIDPNWYPLHTPERTLDGFEASFLLAKEQVRMFTPEYIEVWIKRLRRAMEHQVKVNLAAIDRMLEEG